MSAVLSERRTKPVIKKASGDPLSRLSALRKEIATAIADLQRAEDEQRRCEEEAKKHHAVTEAVTEARARLASLHEARSSGIGRPSDRQIASAEQAVSTAVERARHAESAEQGAVAAAARFAKQAEGIQPTLNELVKKAKRAQAEILHARAMESRARYRQACERFMVDYAKHVAEVSAGSAAAKALGLTIEDLIVDGRTVHAAPGGPIDLWTSEIWISPFDEATREERMKERGGKWSFDIAETVEEQVEPLVRQLVKELNL